MKAINARILISCLALATMFIMAVPANAQGVAFQASSLPLQARGEGLTETIGAVVLQATATGTVPNGSSITIVYSGSIANTGGFTGTAGLSCSIGGSSSCANFSVSATGSQLTVQVNTQTIFKSGDYIEVSQVRMNVNALGSAATTVTATLSGTSALPASNPITFTQSTVGVSSIVNPSIKGTVTAGTPPIQTCSVSTVGFTVQVKENYPAALTSVSDETNFSSVVAPANGSQINVTFNNLPTGFGVSWAAPSTTTIALNAVGSTPAAGTPAFSTGAAITFSYAMAGGSTSAIDSTTIPFTLGYTNSKGTAFATAGSSAPALGTVVSPTATVSLGPSSGIVSFATNNEGSGSIGTLGDCVTNLLFPFTTNQVGFDTNIQISNTSADKLAFPSGGAIAQAGTCTLTYYPTDLTTQTSSAAGTAGTPSQFTTPSIPAGGAYSFAQSTSTFKGQSGYMFAVCRFLDAHGFSYVVNGTPTTGTISQGLLALVIPNTSISGLRLANPACTTVATCVGFAGGTYEGIAH